MSNPDQTTDKYAELVERATNNAHYLIADGTGLIIRDLLAAVQDEREARLKAEAALSEMQGVEERLPVTRDGVWVASLDTIFFVHPDVDHIMECKEYAVDMFLNVAFVQFQKAQYRTDVYGYSSKETAEAALAARKGE